MTCHWVIDQYHDWWEYCPWGVTGQVSWGWWLQRQFDKTKDPNIAPPGRRWFQIYLPFFFFWALQHLVNVTFSSLRTKTSAIELLVRVLWNDKMAVEWFCGLLSDRLRPILVMMSLCADNGLVKTAATQGNPFSLLTCPVSKDMSTAAFF